MRAARGAPTGLLAVAVLVTGAHAQSSTDIHVLEIMLRNGNVLVIGAPRAVTERDGYDNQPAFTHDGGALLYTSIRDGQADSWSFDIAAESATRLTRTPESEYSPTPIPGSDRFSVVRVEADSTQRLWSFAADGSDPRLVLADLAPIGYHAWTADGRLALFVLGDPPTLRLADPRTGRSRTVARDIGRSIQPIPGRNAISFTQRLGDGWWIRELDLERRSLRALVPLMGEDHYHAWMPDGALLTAHGTGIYQWEDVGTGRWRLVADVADSDLGAVTRLAVSHDGRRLAIVVDRPPAP